MVAALVAAACTVGPNYARPPVSVPATYRGADPAAPAATSFGDLKWWEVFGDPTLQSLLRTALQQNVNVQVAAARILEAQARLGISRADQLPEASGSASAIDQRTSNVTGFPSRTIRAIELQGAASWDLDFWGRYRRATEAARAQLLSTEWARRAVLTTLVSQVADAYFGLRALDLQLDLSKQTLASRQESLRLTQVREQGGVTTLLDVRQAEQLVYGASSEIASLEREIEQQENYLSVLLGNNPGPIARGASLTDQPQPRSVPAGLPSTLLERRPDVQQAEDDLIAANAQIGVARAAYFPSIALTGSAGVESSALSTLVSGPAGIWTAAASLAQPIFTAGRTRSQVALAEARHEELVATYQQAIREAFREVSDALVGYRKSREFREQQALLLTAARDARRLSDVRYQGGATSYLEVLDADTRLFNAQLGLADARLRELTSMVEIYRALGGGWQQ
ncbi:MAG TPA: efflux transporter outer membrane subunit [Vicinamibacterales bacterium]|nr:efflux transporter outer membrane subunit [Vicinamibacterales bacterium]